MLRIAVAMGLAFFVGGPVLAENEPKLPQDLKMPEGTKPFMMTANSMRTPGELKVSQKVDVRRIEPIVKGKAASFLFVEDVQIVHIEKGEKKNSVAFIVLAVTPEQLEKLKAPEKRGFWILKER